jgi:hypothetical protein
MTGIEVNNFDRISNLLSFDGKTIYLVWLVVRNKDKSTELKGNNRNRTIKSYYFTTKEHFESRWDEIIKLCKTFNCRAYIGINGKPLKSMNNNDYFLRMHKLTVKRNLKTEDYLHKASRYIVDYCRENNIITINPEEYKEVYSDQMKIS